MRHARPAAHTLRAVVRSAAVTRSSAPVQSISQRKRQRLTAAATTRELEPAGTSLTLACTCENPFRDDGYSVTAPRYSVLVRFTPLSAGRSTCSSAAIGVAETVSLPSSRITPLQVRLTPLSGAKRTELWSRNWPLTVPDAPFCSVTWQVCSTATGHACCCRAIRESPWQRAP